MAEEGRSRRRRKGEEDEEKERDPQESQEAKEKGEEDKSAQQSMGVGDSGRKRRKKLRIGFLHVDLGIGGAEQMIIHLARGLQEEGHKISVYTSFYEKERTVDGTDAVDIVERGRWLPRTLFGGCTALMSIIRMVYVAIYMWSTGGVGTFDVIVADQVSAVNPLLKCMARKVLFYCHYPDRLLCPKPTSTLRKCYRHILDRVEEYTTGVADLLVANSEFTKGVLERTFPSITLDSSRPFFLSVNRYEDKKEVDRAVDALGYVCAFYRSQGRANEASSLLLLIAGGYDERVVENRKNYEYLKKRVEASEDIDDSQVLMLRSVSTLLKWYLMYKAVALLYTPIGEHFGMVPCEAMAVGTPVVACRSGGPTETVLHARTGWLCDATPKAFAHCMEEALQWSKSVETRERVRADAMAHVRAHFSLEACAGKCEEILQKALEVEGGKQE